MVKAMDAGTQYPSLSHNRHHGFHTKLKIIFTGIFSHFYLLSKQVYLFFHADQEKFSTHRQYKGLSALERENYTADKILRSPYLDVIL